MLARPVFVRQNPLLYSLSKQADSSAELTLAVPCGRIPVSTIREEHIWPSK